MDNFICIGTSEIPTELAITEQEQCHGLMFRTNLPPAMAFIYGKPQINRFWMKSTPKPLDIVFCHQNHIVDIQVGKPYSTALIGGNYLSDLVIEFPEGTCKAKNFQVGDSVSLKLSNTILRKIFATTHNLYR